MVCKVREWELMGDCSGYDQVLSSAPFSVSGLTADCSMGIRESCQEVSLVI
jgi:hypothetical protein